MKVSEAIEMLKRHNPDEQILILYWAKDLFEDKDLKIDDDIWNQVIDEREYSRYIDSVNEGVYTLINEGIEEVTREEQR